MYNVLKKRGWLIHDSQDDFHVINDVKIFHGT